MVVAQDAPSDVSVNQPNKGHSKNIQVWYVTWVIIIMNFWQFRACVLIYKKTSIMALGCKLYG